MKGRRGEAASYFQNTVLRYEGDECLLEDLEREAARLASKIEAARAARKERMR